MTIAAARGRSILRVLFYDCCAIEHYDQSSGRCVARIPTTCIQHTYNIRLYMQHTCNTDYTHIKPDTTYNTNRLVVYTAVSSWMNRTATTSCVREHNVNSSSPHREEVASFFCFFFFRQQHLLHLSPLVLRYSSPSHERRNGQSVGGKNVYLVSGSLVSPV